jgi:septal ring factor EnvC (AmiA/AmiB activator)
LKPRKFLSIVGIVVFIFGLFTPVTTFAQIPQPTMVLVSSQTQLTSQLSTRETRERIRLKLLNSVREIENNRALVKEMVIKAKEKTFQVRQKINDLKGNLDSLSIEQLAVIKEVITDIKEQPQSNEAYFFKLSGYNKKIRSARESKDFDTLLILYSEIITVQSTHISSLERYIKLLDKILAIPIE